MDQFFLGWKFFMSLILGEEVPFSRELADGQPMHPEPTLIFYLVSNQTQSGLICTEFLLFLLYVFPSTLNTKKFAL